MRFNPGVDRVPPHSMTSTTTINPTTGDELATYENHTDAELAEIIDSAHDAFDDWREGMEVNAHVQMALEELFLLRAE